MAGAAERVELKGQEQAFRQGLIRLGSFDFRGLHVKIGHALRNSTLNRFRAEEAPDGTPWDVSQRAFLASFTGRKDRQGNWQTKSKPGKTLQRTGRLRRSIKDESTAEYAAVGSNVVYARIHQLGGEAGPKARRVQIPARPYLGLSPDDEELVQTMAQSVIRRALGQGGGQP